jgi:hypothetical protein
VLATTSIGAQHDGRTALFDPEPPGHGGVATGGLPATAAMPGSEGGFSSLTGVSALFDNPWGLLAGWTHYLAFDLFIGGWEVRDARRRGIPHLLVVPALALTFLLGPGGLLLYLGIRSFAPNKGTPANEAIE